MKKLMICIPTPYGNAYVDVETINSIAPIDSNVPPEDERESIIDYADAFIYSTLSPDDLFAHITEQVNLAINPPSATTPRHLGYPTVEEEQSDYDKCMPEGFGAPDFETITPPHVAILSPSGFRYLQSLGIQVEEQYAHRIIEAVHDYGDGELVAIIEFNGNKIRLFETDLYVKK